LAATRCAWPMAPSTRACTTSAASKWPTGRAGPTWGGHSGTHRALILASPRLGALQVSSARPLAPRSRQAPGDFLQRHQLVDFLVHSLCELGVEL
jgi:hypothetical protein